MQFLRILYRNIYIYIYMYSYIAIYVVILPNWRLDIYVFVVFTANKTSFWNLFYFTPYLNCYTRFHSSLLYNKGQITTFSSIIERKHYVRFTRLLKIALFSFERRLAIHSKKYVKNWNNYKLQEFYTSFYDWQSYKLRLVLGGILHD